MYFSFFQLLVNIAGFEQRNDGYSSVQSIPIQHPRDRKFVNTVSKGYAIILMVADSSVVQMVSDRS